MAEIAYVLDTNVISDLVKGHPLVYARVQNARTAGERLILPQPVYYEVLRGLLWINASARIKTLQESLLPIFQWKAIVDADWIRAAYLWAETVSAGKQLDDVDLLVAAVATRLNAVVVSSDTDYDAVTVKRENWRDPPQTSP